MPVTRTRYRPDRKSFGEMMVSSQIRDVAVAGARDIAAVATADQKIAELPYGVNELAGNLVVAGNPRAIAEVVGEDRLHAVEEFGSGTASTGNNPGKPRPQGGYSAPHRTLARAAAKVIPEPVRPPA